MTEVPTGGGGTGSAAAGGGAIGPDAGAGAAMVLPDFTGRCLTNVFGSVAASIGVAGHDDPIGLPPLRRWVVLLVDGLGWHNLRAEPRLAPYLNGLVADDRPATVSAPSTTITSLTSLGTGVAPGQHGMVGYTFRLPGAKGAVLNALTWRLPHSPRTVQPVPTLLQRLEDELAVTTVSLARFADTGLTEAALRGGRFQPVVNEDDAAERRAGVVAAATAADRTLVYAYERRLDMIGHTDGWDSDVWRNQLAVVDHEIASLRAALPADVGLLVTADHGMVDVPGDRMVVMEDHPELAAGVDCIAGEGRFRQLYCDHEPAAAVAARWQDWLGARAWVRTRDAAVEEGWFGPVDDAVRARIGDVLVAARDETAVMTRTLSQELTLVGMHGSLTPQEMLVPMVVVTG